MKKLIICLFVLSYLFTLGCSQKEPEPTYKLNDEICLVVDKRANTCSLYGNGTPLIYRSHKKYYVYSTTPKTILIRRFNEVVTLNQLPHSMWIGKIQVQALDTAFLEECSSKFMLDYHDRLSRPIEEWLEYKVALYERKNRMLRSPDGFKEHFEKLIQRQARSIFKVELKVWLYDKPIPAEDGVLGRFYDPLKVSIQGLFDKKELKESDFTF